ncbi:MAG TPA: hypothetical protein PLG15_02310 [Candidatus Gastranaerophilaceae bacterium]|nr:hypothetical protein [Candidatus Gastranaerophilaceae bacterium]
MKNKLWLNLLFSFLFLMFSTALFACATEPNAPMSQNAPVTQTIPAQSSAMPATIPEKNAYELTHMEKDGFKYGILKFLLAMTGVLVSALAIFLGLKIYQKFVLNKTTMPAKTVNGSELETPKDFKDALNLFLDKTDK